MQIYIWVIAEKMGRTAEPTTHHPSNREIFTMQNLQVFCQKNIKKTQNSLGNGNHFIGQQMIYPWNMKTENYYMSFWSDSISKKNTVLDSYRIIIFIQVTMIINHH